MDLPSPGSYAILSPSLFTWVSLGSFPQVISGADLTATAGAAWFFFASYYPPHILYHNGLSEPAGKFS